MPSPIAHGAVAFLIARRLRTGFPELAGTRWPALASLALLGTMVVLSLLPDLDVVAALVYGDMEGFHNQASHSFLFGLLVAPLAGGVLWALGRWGFWPLGYWRWTGLALLAYQLHVVMDYFSKGRGVRLLWPFEDDRYTAPMPLFYGVRWADGWWTSGHLLTLLNELAFAALIFIAAFYRRPRRG